MCGVRVRVDGERYGSYGDASMGARWNVDVERMIRAERGACRTYCCGCMAKVPETGVATDGRVAWRGFDTAHVLEDI